MLQKLVHCLKEKRLMNLEDLPSEVPGSSVSSDGEINETDKNPGAQSRALVQNDAHTMPPEFMAMVGKLEGVFCQDERASAEDPPISPPPRSADESHLIAKSRAEASENLSTISECIALQSGRISGMNGMRSQLGDREGKPDLRNHAEKVEPPGATTSTRSDPLSFEQALESLVMILGERVSAELKDSNKAFIQELRKEMAGLLEDSLESLVKMTVDQCRREFGPLINELSDLHNHLLGDTAAKCQVDRISDWMRTHGATHR